MELDALLARLIELGGSDLHLKVDSPAMARVDGTLVPIDERVLSDPELEAVLARVTERSPAKREHFFASGELDIAYLAPDVGRFRVNGFRQRGSVSFAFRYVPRVVPSFKTLGLPPGVEKLTEEHRGLILVTGATGSGKSTTLAAMIDRINRTRKQHIVTIEDPIEIVHDDWGCIVNQREIGLDTDSYSQALRRVLRQDPDVILIGELRDEESARAAIQASESGHLVLSTMHTIDATETVGRLIEMFPPTKQMMVRQILAGVLRGVVSQRLLPRAGGGRVVAVEVMMNTARIADMIREPDKTHAIPEAIEEGGFHLMQTFNQHLIQLVLVGLVDEETAANASSNRHDFMIALQQAIRRKEVEEREGTYVPGYELASDLDETDDAKPPPPPPPAEVPGLRLA
jgi:twitching motility protein PilT